MSPFQIGGTPPRPVPGISKSRQPEKKETAETAAPPPKSGFDTASVSPNRLAVMPRMSSVGSQSAQRVQGGAVESMLRENAAELDDYFASAYGFKE